MGKVVNIQWTNSISSSIEGRYNEPKNFVFHSFYSKYSCPRHCLTRNTNQTLLWSVCERRRLKRMKKQIVMTLLNWTFLTWLSLEGINDEEGQWSGPRRSGQGGVKGRPQWPAPSNPRRPHQHHGHTRTTHGTARPHAPLHETHTSLTRNSGNGQNNYFTACRKNYLG